MTIPSSHDQVDGWIEGELWDHKRPMDLNTGPCTKLASSPFYSSPSLSWVGSMSDYVDMDKLPESQLHDTLPCPDRLDATGIEECIQQSSRQIKPSQKLIHKLKSEARLLPLSQAEQSSPKRQRRLSSSCEWALEAEFTPDKLKTSKQETIIEPVAEKPHAAVERRYRENINSKISQLHQMLCVIQVTNEEASFHFNKFNTENSTKISKADVLSNAMRYVKRAEQEKKAMGEEIKFLRRGWST